MIRPAYAAALALSLLAGCSTSDMSPVTSDHPASSRASEAPLLPPSTTLSLTETAPVAPVATHVPAGAHSGHDSHAGDRAADNPPKAEGGGMGDPAHSHHAGQDGAATHQAQPPATQPAAPAIYTCPMHREIVFDKPGKCPKCFMKLIKKNPPDAGHGDHE